MRRGDGQVGDSLSDRNKDVEIKSQHPDRVTAKDVKIVGGGKTPENVKIISKNER